MTTRRLPPRICWHGVTPCGAPARLYTCGWRCHQHRPDSRRAAT